MNLTNGEIYTAYIEAANQTLRPQDERIALAFARAIIAATLDKLAAGVSVEPDTSTDYHMDMHGQRAYTVEAFATAIAAARVQALEEAIALCNEIASVGREYAAEDCVTAIRALIGAKTC